LDVDIHDTSKFNTLFETINNKLPDQLSLTFDNVMQIVFENKKIKTDIKLHDKCFDKFYCIKPISISMCSRTFVRILNIAQNGDTVSLSISRTHEESIIEKLKVKIYNSGKKVSSYIKVCRIGYPLQEKIVWDGTLTIPSKDIMLMYQYSHTIYINILCKHDKVNFINKLYCENEIKTTYYNLGTNMNYDEMYRIDELREISTYDKLSDKIKLHFKQSCPLKAELDMDNFGTISIYISPQK
jgi:hypothetical protein